MSRTTVAALALVGGWSLVTWAIALATGAAWVWPASAGIAFLLVGVLLVSWVYAEVVVKARKEG